METTDKQPTKKRRWIPRGINGKVETMRASLLTNVPELDEVLDSIEKTSAGLKMPADHVLGVINMVNARLQSAGAEVEVWLTGVQQSLSSSEYPKDCWTHTELGYAKVEDGTDIHGTPRVRWCLALRGSDYHYDGSGRVDHAEATPLTQARENVLLKALPLLVSVVKAIDKQLKEVAQRADVSPQQ